MLVKHQRKRENPREKQERARKIIKTIILGIWEMKTKKETRKMFNKDIRWCVSGSPERIFLSTSFGCNCQCKYCYLNQIGSTGIQYTFTKQEILDELYKKRLFVPGKMGSIITIGCFTECFDEKNAEVTMELIHFFLHFGNMIQISTKKALWESDIVSIKSGLKYRDQMNFFISLPTISLAGDIEPEADIPAQRIRNLDVIKKHGMNVCLFIKPILDTVTLKDKERYIALVRKYNVPVVLGEKLSPLLNNTRGDIKIGMTCMKEMASSDSDELVSALEKYTKVYRHSYEMLEELRTC